MLQSRLACRGSESRCAVAESFVSEDEWTKAYIKEFGAPPPEVPLIDDETPRPGTRPFLASRKPLPMLGTSGARVGLSAACSQRLCLRRGAS
jgi:hypothetical protein